MAAALAKVKRVGVVDRSVELRLELRAGVSGDVGRALSCRRRLPAVSFIGGLAGADITVEHFARAIALTREARAGAAADEPIWLNEND